MFGGNPSYAHRGGEWSPVAVSYGMLNECKCHWAQDDLSGEEVYLDPDEDAFWTYDEEQCYWMRRPFQGRSQRRGKTRAKARARAINRGGSSAHTERGMAK